MKIVNNEEKEFEIKANLVITDFECFPDEITRILGIQPTETWRKGDSILSIAKNIRKQNGWILKSIIDPKNNTVNVQVESLLSIISPNIEKFANLPSDAEVELACIVYINRTGESIGFPEIGFSSNTISVLAKINAVIDIDLYCLSDD
jgi:hypothetical protein